MKLLDIHARQLVTALMLSLSLMLFAAGADAAGCKGQTKSACSNTDDCYWVDGYKRKDGARISGHCRAKPGKSEKSNHSDNDHGGKGSDKHKDKKMKKTKSDKAEKKLKSKAEDKKSAKKEKKEKEEKKEKQKK